MTNKKQKKHHSLYLPEELSEKVQSEGEETSRTFSHMISYMIEQYFKEKNK